jgi:hypothetical protein
MNKNLILLFFSVFIICSASGQASFQKTYGGSSTDIAYSVQQTSDGGYIVVGYTFSFGDSSSNIYLVKTNNTGDTLWTKAYGGQGNDYAYAVEQTSDNGFIITGSTNSFGAGGYDVFLLKINAVGDFLWSKTYGGISDEQAYAVQETSGGGYIISGYTQSFGAGNTDAYVIRTNSLGDTLWTKTYGGAHDDDGLYIRQTFDNGFILCGYTQEVVAGQRSIYLVKTNSAGDTLWTKAYGGADEDFGVSVKQTPDSGFIIASTTFSFGAGGSDACLTKTNSAGNIVWSKTYGGVDYEYTNSVCLSQGGGYLLNAYTTSFGTGSQSIYLVKTNNNGDTLWTKVIGGTSANEAYDARQTADGGFIIAGLTNSFGVNGYDNYLVKTDLNGNYGCYIEGTASTVTTCAMQTNHFPSIVKSTHTIVSDTILVASSGGSIIDVCSTVNVQSLLSEHQTFKIFPNPAHASFTIVSGDENLNCKISIYNVLGEEVYSANIENFSTYIVNQDFLVGIYFVRIMNNKGETSVANLIID